MIITLEYEGTILYQGLENSDPEENVPPTEVIKLNIEEDQFSFFIEDLGHFYLSRLKSMNQYDLLHEEAKKLMRKIINVSAFFLLLDIGLFFVMPYLAVHFLKLDIDFSPIPFGATFSLCGTQVAWISALFYQYRQENVKADYVFRGKQPFPPDRKS